LTNNPFDLNSPFDDIMGRFFGGRDPFSVLGARQDPTSSVQRVDLSLLLSEEARDLVRAAVEQAGQWGSSDVDAEHLLWALTQAPATASLLEQAGVDVAATEVVPMVPRSSGDESCESTIKR